MDGIAERLALTPASSPLLFWVLGSIAAYAVATHTFWLLRSRLVQRPIWIRLLEQVGRFLFFLGIPYLALGGWPRRPFQGLFSPEEMGMVALSERWTVNRWLGAVSTGVGVGLVALTILILAWVNASRGDAGARLYFPPRPWWTLLIDILYQQVHWAFCRAALAVVWDSPYAGVFGGLGLVILEWGLNPFWRRGWRLESTAAEQWLRTAMALVAALLFLLTRNLWICLGIHCLLEPCLRRLGAAPARSIDGQALPVP